MMRLNMVAAFLTVTIWLSYIQKKGSLIASLFCKMCFHLLLEALFSSLFQICFLRSIPLTL